MKAFSYGKTIHAQPLTEKGRENWDRAFGKKEEEKKEEKHQER
jgi:hypothetical protein